ncbi:flavodoxin-dependent (E)-4-hydroxy-3-methylbut-2-enyl-diphosphate synthase, partial [Candidatus Omnitrophota bacterium]
LRVSLNSSSIEEVRAAKMILQTLGFRNLLPEIISCPTCSRCKVNLREKVETFRSFIYSRSFPNKDIRIALMGCPVNGPGEASSADVGIAFGRGFGVLFEDGKIIKRLPERQCLDILKKRMMVK